MTLLSFSCVLFLEKFLHLKLTEYLGDFHPWLSAYSCPSYSSHTHVQRLSVCMLHLQGYMCVGTMLINLLEEQVFIPFYVNMFMIVLIY